MTFRPLSASATRRVQLSAAVIAVLLAAAPTLAYARPVVPVAKPAPQQRLTFDTSKFMPESDIRYGQTGYALTVNHGTKIERFGIELLGVMRKMNNGRDLIAFRATSGPSVTRQAMIVEGMSGSPVYVGGRLVGAIAYGLSFSREPIGLITPIRDMLDSWDPDLPATPNLTGAEASRTLSMSPQSVTVSPSQLGAMGGGGVDLSQSGGPLTFEPMMTPVAVSGLSPQIMDKLALSLAPLHLMPVAGSAPAGANQPDSEAARVAAGKVLTPGAAVGVSLAQGDVDMTAIGTLTYRVGNKIVAFGHPFTGIGPIDAALTTASITDILPSYQSSIKLGAPVTTVGRIFQDRPFSVGGQIGPAPQMIPVSVTIEDLSDKRTKTYHARVINHPLLTGALALSVAGEAILEVHGTPGDAVAYVTTDVDADQVGHIVRKNVFFDPLAVNSAATGDLSDIVGMLSSNPFYQLNVRSVNMTVRIEDAHPTAEIDHIVVPRTTYQPGDTVNVGVVLRPYKKDPVVKNVSLTIPANVPDGTVILSVRGGASASAPTLSLGAGGTITLGHSGDSGMPLPATVQQVVKQYLQEPENNDLVASISLPTGAPVVDGEKLSLLPPTMAAIMRQSHASALHLVRDSVKTTAAMPYVLTGDQTITLTIRAQDNFDRSTTSDSGSAGSGGSVSPLSISPSGGSSSSTTTTTIASAGGDGSIGGISDTAPADSDESGKLVAEQTGDNPAPAPTPTPNPSPGPVPNPEPTPSPTQPPGGGAQPPVPPLAVPDLSAGTSSSSSTTTTTTSSGDDLPGSLDSSSSDFDSPSDDSTAPASVERVASIWRENTESAFDNGTLDGVAVTSAPDVRLAPKFDLLGSTSATYVWSQAYDPQGNLYIGTGDDGLIYKIAPNASQNTPPTLLARTGQLEVTALAFNPITRDLYAATAPHGMVFRITPDGKSKLMAQTPDSYIPSMLLDQSGRTLYLATGGGKGRIYSVDLNASVPMSSAAAMAAPKAIFTSPDVHLLCLAQGPDGLLYAGGNPNGVVYKIDPAQAMNTPESAKEQVVYDSPTATVSSIAVDGANRLFVGTAGGGAVYRVNLTAAAKSPYSAPQIAKTEIAKTADFVSGMTVDNAGNIWASSGDTLYRITPNVRDSSGDDVVTTFPSDPQVSYTSIVASPFSGAVSAGTASIAAVYGYGSHGAGVGLSANAQETTGTYVSAIHDALLKSRWGVATWSADAASGGAVALQTRTGDVALPDKTWSDWSASLINGAGSRISSPAARFIQYRAILTAPNASAKNAAAPDSGSVYAGEIGEYLLYAAEQTAIGASAGSVS